MVREIYKSEDKDTLTYRQWVDTKREYRDAWYLFEHFAYVSGDKPFPHGTSVVRPYHHVAAYYKHQMDGLWAILLMLEAAMTEEEKEWVKRYQLSRRRKEAKEIATAATAATVTRSWRTGSADY